MALTGTEDAVVVQRLKHFKRLDVRIVAGKPFSLPPVKGKDRDAAMQEYTDEVMCRIAALSTCGATRGICATSAVERVAE